MIKKKKKDSRSKALTNEQNPVERINRKKFNFVQAVKFDKNPFAKRNSLDKLLSHALSGFS